MAQGYIYEMSEDIESIGFMREEDRTLRESFAAMLKSNGATVKVITDDTSDGLSDEVIAVSDINDTCKMNYFRERFKEMKRLAEAITLAQFSIDSSDLTLYKLERSISNEYGDVVSLDDVCYSLDEFIRTADPKGTYYLGNVSIVQ